MDVDVEIPALDAGRARVNLAKRSATAAEVDGARIGARRNGEIRAERGRAGGVTVEGSGTIVRQGDREVELDDGRVTRRIRCAHVVGVAIDGDDRRRSVQGEP